MSFVSKLTLTNFRCYESARLEGLSSGAVVLTGPNGAGKTNVLEAVSLLSPGRGLRGAKNMEIQSRPETDPPPGLPPSQGGGEVRHIVSPLQGGRLEGGKESGGKSWAVAATIETPNGSVKIGTGLDPQTDKRTVRINGETAKGQNALADYLACVWLTPQMDRLFLDSAGQRRRFLDRLVFAFDPGHSGRTTRYENAMRQRSKLLQEGKADPAWLAGLEAQMAETGTAIAAARLDFVQRLQSACDKAEDRHFPRTLLAATGTIEELLQNAPALEVEESFKYQLEQTRARDAVTGGASSGPHRSDLSVRYAAKNMPADQCSTGEQKALLIGMILAHARLIAAERGRLPVLLLDEVAAHLDDERRAALFDLLLDLGGQVWLTGTDEGLFAGLENRAQYFRVEDATVEFAS